MSRGGWTVAAAGVLVAGCLGGTARPAVAPYPEGAHIEVTGLRGPVAVHRQVADSLSAESCTVRRIGGRIAKASGDTLWFRTVETLEPMVVPPPLECPASGTAAIVVTRDSAQVVRIVPVSAARQILGSALLWAAVGGAILLIVSGADGLIDAVGRWF